MSAATTPITPLDPTPFEVPGPVTRVPPLEELRRLTAVPDRRVVFRNVDWDFYEKLVDSVPEGANLHVDFDGIDLEIVSHGPWHAIMQSSLGHFVSLVASAMGIPFRGLGSTTWKRPEIERGLEADQCFYFLLEKLLQCAAASKRDSNDVADYPNPDLAIEVDITPPQVDRAGIYAALRVAEVWRFDDDQVIFERLTPGGKYAVVEASGFLPVRAEEARHWLVEEEHSDDMTWGRRLRAAMLRKARRLALDASGRGEAK
jgi:Uma2 family endonuclease